MQPLAPTDPREAGEFRLSARLGVGGMGRVFLGYSPAGRAVAVKICHPDLAADPAFVRRFAREASAAQAVNGLYTAQVVAAGPYDHPPWMATAYVPGPSLADYVDDFGPLPEPAAWRLAAGLAEALLAVHATGLVHRDLKPANVLLAVDGPRVIDFGIASALEETALTATGSVLGSPPYMAPEQAMGMPAGPASDVFALGATLTFAAAGEPPFGHGDAPAVLFRVVHMDPALGSLPDRLRAMVAACLAKDPAARPTLPQLLRACQDAAAAGGNSAASFWPSQMTAAIAGYQASPVSAAPPPGTGPSGAQGAPHPPTAATAPGGSTWRAPFGRVGTTVASAIGRRRVLSGLGGLVVAGGLAAAGWELAGPGSTAAAGGTADQRVAWTHPTGGPVRSGAAISGDGATLYIGSDDGTVYALDAATGQLAQKFPVGGAVSGVTVAGTTLLAGSADRSVHAFTIGNLGVSWTSTAAGAAIAGAPTSGGGVVYAGSADHYVYALDFTTGQRKWRTETGGTTVAGAPQYNVVWAGSLDGHLYALDTGTVGDTGTRTVGGTVDGRFAAGGAIRPTPLSVASSVYFGADNGFLYSASFDSLGSSSPVYWRFAADGAIQGTPAYTGETICTATASGYVYALDMGTGTQLWRSRVAGPVRSGLAIRDGVLYLGCDDGYLYALDVSTGAQLWRSKTGGAIRSAILAPGDLVYFGSLDHRVYALRA
jgi:outer membrane protein assembly factor BamB